MLKEIDMFKYVDIGEIMYGANQLLKMFAERKDRTTSQKIDFVKQQFDEAHAKMDFEKMAMFSLVLAELVAQNLDEPIFIKILKKNPG